MEERTRNVAVGLTALVGLVGLMALLLLFGWVPGWLDGGYRITVKLPHAAGLSEESRVELNGIPVGRVESLGLMPQPDTGVVAELSIRSGVAIPEDAEAVVRAPLLLGGQSRIEFTTAEMDEVEDVLEPGAVVRGSIPDLASQLTQEFRSALAGPEAELSAAVESFESLSSEWQQVGERVNTLLEPRSIEAVEAGEAEPNLITMLHRADRRLTEMEDALAGVNAVIGDPELREDLRVTIRNTRELSQRLDATVAEVGDQVTADVQALRSRYIALADDLSGAIGHANQLLEQARAGEGTMGQLVQNPELYENLTDATERLQTAIDEMRLLIQKWKAEGLPVQF